MKVVKTEYIHPFAYVHLGDWDEDVRRRVVGASRNPEVIELANERGLERDSGLGFTLYAPGDVLAFRMCVPDKCIIVREGHIKDAEEFTKIILGESLDKAISDYRKANAANV